MGRYFFHYRDGVDYLDHTGIELSDVSAAKRMALTTAGEAIVGLGAKFWEEPEWHTWVTDESGAVLCSFTFKVDDQWQISPSPPST